MNFFRSYEDQLKNINEQIKNTPRIKKEYAELQAKKQTIEKSLVEEKEKELNEYTTQINIQFDNENGPLNNEIESIEDKIKNYESWSLFAKPPLDQLNHQRVDLIGQQSKLSVQLNKDIKAKSDEINQHLENLGINQNQPSQIPLPDSDQDFNQPSQIPLPDFDQEFNQPSQIPLPDSDQDFDQEFNQPSQIPLPEFNQPSQIPLPGSDNDLEFELNQPMERRNAIVPQPMERRNAIVPQTMENLVEAEQGNKAIKAVVAETAVNEVEEKLKNVQKDTLQAIEKAEKSNSPQDHQEAKEKIVELKKTQIEFSGIKQQANVVKQFSEAKVQNAFKNYTKESGDVQIALLKAQFEQKNLELKQQYEQFSKEAKNAYMMAHAYNKRAKITGSFDDLTKSKQFHDFTLVQKQKALEIYRQLQYSRDQYEDFLYKSTPKKRKSTKRRSSKKRSTKRRSSKKRSTKRKSSKKRSTKRRSSKKRSTKRRSTRARH